MVRSAPHEKAPKSRASGCERAGTAHHLDKHSRDGCKRRHVSELLPSAIRHGILSAQQGILKARGSCNSLEMLLHARQNLTARQTPDSMLSKRRADWDAASGDMPNGSARLGSIGLQLPKTRCETLREDLQTRVHIYEHTYPPGSLSLYIYIYICSMHARMYVRMCTYVHTHVRTYMYSGIYVHCNDSPINDLLIGLHANTKGLSGASRSSRADS